MHDDRQHFWFEIVVKPANKKMTAKDRMKITSDQEMILDRLVQGEPAPLCQGPPWLQGCPEESWNRIYQSNLDSSHWRSTTGGLPRWHSMGSFPHSKLLVLARRSRQRGRTSSGLTLAFWRTLCTTGSRSPGSPHPPKSLACQLHLPNGTPCRIESIYTLIQK